MDCLLELVSRIRSLEDELDNIKADQEAMEDQSGDATGNGDNPESQLLTKQYEETAAKIQHLRSTVPEGELLRCFTFCFFVFYQSPMLRQ